MRIKRREQDLENAIPTGREWSAAPFDWWYWQAAWHPQIVRFQSSTGSLYMIHHTVHQWTDSSTHIYLIQPHTRTTAQRNKNENERDQKLVLASFTIAKVEMCLVGEIRTIRVKN